ncbi:MAG: zinc-ribbon domain-containing protein [Candidatus Lokiarchaeota archaeon]
MSNNKDEKLNVKYCVHCGAEINKDKVYCPNCGKLAVNIKSASKIKNLVKEESAPKPSKQQSKMTRKCPGCGSIISSPILEQCPICNTKLEKFVPPKDLLPSQESEKKAGFIFTNKKLVPASFRWICKFT